MIEIEGHHIWYPLSKDSIVIDIGCNIGSFSRTVLARYGCRVIGFEPLSYLCENYLQRLKEEFPKFEYHNYAVWTSNGIMEFRNFGKEWVNKDCPNPWGAGTLLDRTEKRETDAFGNKLCTEVITVNTISINDILNKFDVIDLVKIDCEGAEIDILQNVDEKEILKCRQLTVEFHAWMGEEYKSKISIKDVDNIIKRFNKMGYSHIIYKGHPDVLFYRE